MRAADAQNSNPTVLIIFTSWKWTQRERQNALVFNMLTYVTGINSKRLIDDDAAQYNPHPQNCRTQMWPGEDHLRDRLSPFLHLKFKPALRHPSCMAYVTEAAIMRSQWAERKGKERKGALYCTITGTKSSKKDTRKRSDSTEYKQLTRTRTLMDRCAEQNATTVEFYDSP